MSNSPDTAPSDSRLDHALPLVLREVSKAAHARSLSTAVGAACDGDRQRLAACLEGMSTDRLEEAAAAAQLLFTEAGQALERRRRAPAPARDGLAK